MKQRLVTQTDETPTQSIANKNVQNQYTMSQVVGNGTFGMVYLVSSQTIC